MTITGCEPRLSTTRTGTRGAWRLSPRRLATLLNALPPDAISLDAAAAMLRSEGIYVRYNAARLLGERGDRDARLILADALRTGEGPTRASVARHLGRLSWYSAEPLLREALRDPDDRVREGAVYALCDLRTLAAFDLLAGALADETNDVRKAAAWSLRHCQDPAAVPALAETLRADDPEVRIQALESLAANESPGAVPVVETALNDPDGEVTYNAVLSLIELRGARALPDLIALFRRTSGPRLEPLLRGLFHATNYLHVDLIDLPCADDLIDTLAGALADESPDARKGAVWVLAWMRSKRAAALLIEAFQRERDHTVQVIMLRITASLMTPGVLDDLLAAAQDSPDPAVQEIAARIRADHASGHYAAYDESAAAAAPLRREELRL